MKFLSVFSAFLLCLTVSQTPAHGAEEAPDGMTAQQLYRLGAEYAQGIGRAADTEKANQYFTRAALMDYPPAQYALGVLALRDGEVATALNLFLAAGKGGYDQAQYQLGVMYANAVGVEKSLPEAFDWLSRAADKGHIAAQYSVGQMYMTGSGIQKDAKTALNWFRKSANQGYSRAQYSVGFMLYKGEGGVPKNFPEAAQWFEKAAVQWHTQSQVSLGTMYFNGEGVKQDLVQAYKWWDIAAAAGNVESHTLCKIAASKMTPVQIALARKQSLEWTAQHENIPHEHAASPSPNNDPPPVAAPQKN